MMYRNKPHFIIKANLQKSKTTGVYFSDVVTPDILSDVSQRITGQTDFTYSYVDNNYEDEFLGKGYNKGRIAIMQYKDTAFYISFSEKDIGGRNSSVQSVPTAFNMFYMNPYPKKRLCYYFLNVQGNAGTEYQLLMYRLMETIGFEFLNADIALTQSITAFGSIEDIMHSRRANARRNRSNNSTFITKSSINQFDIYGKTYGANKYETSMMCYALSLLAQPNQNVTLYEMLEGKLKELPKPSLDVLTRMNNVTIVPTNMQLEKRAFEENNSLRSPRYIYNLLDRLGPKHCALCGCEIPELIQGAHIWPVAEIKKAGGLSIDQKLEHALNGNNGIWLCENHHKMFDQGLLSINTSGQVIFESHLNTHDIEFMKKITTIRQLPKIIMSDEFIQYLNIRSTLTSNDKDTQIGKEAKLYSSP